MTFMALMINADTVEVLLPLPLAGEGGRGDDKVPEAERSGNGLRIAAKFLSEHGYTIEQSFSIETAAGPVKTEVYRDGGRVTAVRLEMGRAVIDRGVKSLEVQGSRLDVSVVSVGNPHCVVFGQPQTRDRLLALGPPQG